jgi:hypothetical protein
MAVHRLHRSILSLEELAVHARDESRRGSPLR